MTTKSDNTAKIKAQALELGFCDCGFAPATTPDDDFSVLEKWLSRGFHADMQWMDKNKHLRKDPSTLVPRAKTVISLMLNYYTNKMQEDPEAPVLSKYAYGKDYHRVIRKKLKKLYSYITEIMPDTSGRYFVDSAPVMEHAFARASGLGWIGKNSLLISRKYGSYVFLSEIIIDSELEYSGHEIPDLCGNCRLCVDECPTHAIRPGKMIDSNRCISYLTIEHSGALPEKYRENFMNRVFGCDICQEVCPWNRQAMEHHTPDFVPRKKLMQMDKTRWQELDESQFNSLFEGTPVMRTKFGGLRRNIDFLGD